MNAPGLEVDDGALVAKALSGQQAAYSALMRRHRAAVFRIARHHAGDDDAALDITQQAFIAAFAALGRFDRQRPFSHWMARITLNKCRDHARRQKVRRWLGLPMAEGRLALDPAVDAETALADREQLTRTLQAITALPVGLRDVLVLCGMEAMPQAEAAAILGITTKAVEMRLYRAREKLRTALRE